MCDCIIFAGAELNVSNFDVGSVNDKFVICADKGVLHAHELGIEPDLIVGDFDSLGYKPDNECEIISFKPEKDDTDLMIAIKEAIKRGKKQIMIYGALGGRLDHTIGNIQALAYAVENCASASLISDSDIAAIYAPGEYEISNKQGFSLSLFSYSENVCGINLSGVKYPLENGCITNSFPIGVSNEITGETAKISFEKGLLLVVMSRL
ncbi:thiamine diphosphokinase [Ruminococcus sp. FC2018]|uniref:thiamine diphosphokinase n=1 Tax=Ruminococcus sp. FC2018 TaxID=1410617 RepID=UPI00048AAEF2|nr:thiamine diphosphokinase [Ruminococcus sp. FC2018]